MSFAVAAARVTLLGTMQGGEIFNTSFWVSPAFDDQAGLNDAAAKVGVHWAANNTQQRAIASSSTAFTSIRIGYYAAGASSQTLSGEVGLPAQPVAGNGTSVHPNQVSCVATLRTGLTGRSFRGRMYLPATGAAVSSGGGQLTGALAGLISAEIAQWLTDCAEDGAIGSPQVASSRLGVLTPVNRVGVDTRLDVQRRRANRQAIAGGTETPVPVA